MKKIKTKRVLGIGAVLLSATCFAATSILIKLAYRYGLTPPQVLAWQSWLASIMLFIYALLFQRKIFKVPRRSLKVLAVQGLIGSLGTSVIYAYALIYLPISVAILLLYLYPVLVLGAGAAIWHKRISPQELIAVALTFAGTMIASGVVTGIGKVSVIGLILGIASAVCYAVFNVVGELAVNEVSPLAAMSYAQWFSSLGLIIYLWREIPHMGWQNMEVWGIGLALATVASIFPFYFILIGIQHIGAAQAAIISTFELPMTFVMAAFFLGEFPQVNQWAGGTLVLAGIILLNWRFQHEQQSAQ
ncbi:DMT family transporter [Paradesulfitobacterium aromaticivorans]